MRIRFQPLTCALLALVLPPTFGSAQESVGAASVAVDGESPFSFPIHDVADDNGVRGGTWASGPDYKVAFHDHATFVPVVGLRYPHNLSLTWETIALRVGATELLDHDEVPQRSAAAWRYEYRFAHFTEAYDVRSDGVEQTFVLTQRPAGEGPLVVEGHITTELLAPSRPHDHGELVFHHEDGTPIVRYGAAFAIDAAGRREPMTTAFDGRRIELRLGAAWLATATFPVVIDPLLGSAIVTSDSFLRLGSSPDVARDDRANELLTSYSRATSASDYDAYARMSSSSFGGPSTVWSDVTANWSSRYTSCGYVSGPSRWLLVVQRDFPTTSSSNLRFHTRDSLDRTTSTAITVLAGGTGDVLTMPQVGGTALGSIGNRGIVVCRSGSLSVVGSLVDVAANTATPLFNLDTTGAAKVCDGVSVNEVSSGGTSQWVCAWSQRPFTRLPLPGWTDEWRLRIARVNPAGTVSPGIEVDTGSAALNVFETRIAGRDGRYLVTYQTDFNDGFAFEPSGPGRTLWARRIDWVDSDAQPTVGGAHMIASLTSATIRNGALAFDWDTGCHWAAIWQQGGSIEAARIGFDVKVCEAVTVYGVRTGNIGFSPSITFDDDANVFPLVFATDEGGSLPRPIYGDRFAYPTFASPTAYGSGCGPATLGSNATAHDTKPHRGQEFFAIRATGMPTGAVGALNLGLGAVAIPLPFLPGCSLNVDPVIVSLPANAVGTTATVPLPIASSFAGDLFLQLVYVDPSVGGPIPVRLTNGLQVICR